MPTAKSLGIKDDSIYAVGGPFGNLTKLGTITEIGTELQYLKYYVEQNVPQLLAPERF